MQSTSTDSSTNSVSISRVNSFFRGQSFIEVYSLSLAAQVVYQLSPLPPIRWIVSSSGHMPMILVIGCSLESVVILRAKERFL